MPPKKMPAKALTKAELLDLLCVTLDKLKIKAAIDLEKGKHNRDLNLMSEVFIFKYLTHICTGICICKRESTNVDCANA